MKNRLKLSAVSILFLFGCQSGDGGTTTGNPMVKVTMTASSTAASTIVSQPMQISPWLLGFLQPAWALPLPNMTDSGGLSVTFSDAWMVVQEIEFKSNEVADSDEVDGNEVSFEGPFSVNLLSANPDSFGQIRMGKSIIRRIKMKLHRASSLSSNAPAGLLNRSIYWSGAVDGQALVFASSEEYEYESSGPNGLALADNSNILLSIKMANIIKKIDLSGFRSTPPASGLIDETHRYSTAGSKCPSIDSSASDLYSCFKKGLDTESKLGRDDDGNDELESGEESVR